MAYWRKWKSLLWGGIGFIVLAIWMLALNFIPGGYVGESMNNSITMWGIIFLITAIIMIILGFLLSKKQ
jgi:hypothetical protein